MPLVIESFITNPSAEDPDAPMEVKSINMSWHGVGFYSLLPLPPGRKYVIELGLGKQRLVAKIRITACRQAAGKGYEVGTEFL